MVVMAMAHLITPENCADQAAAVAAVTRVAAAVPDPELVVVSVGELGILRGVEARDGQFVMQVTPTYSACPATLAIEMGIEMAVRDAGYDARVERVLAPAWTTDWISDDGRAKLKANGIAPPVAGSAASGETDYFSVVTVPCPRCDSNDTKMLAAFGSTACKAQYQCQSCHEPFDYFKCL